jgi:hypothetical protein
VSKRPVDRGWRGFFNAIASSRSSLARLGRIVPDVFFVSRDFSRTEFDADRLRLLRHRASQFEPCSVSVDDSELNLAISVGGLAIHFR